MPSSATMDSSGTMRPSYTLQAEVLGGATQAHKQFTMVHIHDQ